jgi:potassium-dependent mechanosensitive channel
MRFLSLLHSLRWLVLALALATISPSAAQDQHPLDLDATGAALSTIDSALKDKNLTDSDLQRLRAENDPFGIALQAAIADMTPRLAASVKRLTELTPKSKDAAATTDAATAELESEKAKHDALDARLRAARAMLLQVDDNATRIGARRRELFARETFARSSSILNPQLWLSVWREIPLDIAVMKALVGGWLGSLAGRLTLPRMLGLAGLGVLLASIAIPLRWIAKRYIYLDGHNAPPSRLRRAIAAAWTLLVLAVLPLLWLGAFAYALDLFDISEPRIQGVLDALFDAARLLIIFNALGRGMLSPRRKEWRVVPVSDRAATLIFHGGMAVAVVWAAERLLEPAADAVASLNIAVAGRGLGAALIALVTVGVLRRLAAAAAGATVVSPQADPWAPARTVGWIVAAIVFGATLTGYIAFAIFLVNQVIFLTILASVLYLVDVIVHDGTETLLRPDAPVGARLFAMVGLRRNVLAQIAVVVQGMARVAILVVAAAALLAPWGVQSQDLLSTLRAAYFGVAVGGVTLSLSSLITAAAVFAIALFATRVIQSWLSSRLLPQTRLDPGVGNSISTIFGYVGAIVAVLLGGAQIGLDVQKLALIAGGLSVGIGFGLQTIANNFVSGLILLWERGIRVGDWVVVGAEQGFVRRINARSTEIETFDRATLIVPNSTLVTGVVKNWVHSDRVGRIIVALNVAYESDIEEVREILIAAAKGHDLVLAIPAPTVQLSEFGEWALKFNLICFVDDIEMAERTKSEMNFDILHRLREANIRIPYPQFGQLRPGAK